MLNSRGTFTVIASCFLIICLLLNGQVVYTFDNFAARRGINRRERIRVLYILFFFHLKYISLAISQITRILIAHDYIDTRFTNTLSCSVLKMTATRKASRYISRYSRELAGTLVRFLPSSFSHLLLSTS